MTVIQSILYCNRHHSKRGVPFARTEHPLWFALIPATAVKKNDRGALLTFLNVVWIKNVSIERKSADRLIGNNAMPFAPFCLVVIELSDFPRGGGIGEVPIEQSHDRVGVFDTVILNLVLDDNIEPEVSDRGVGKGSKDDSETCKIPLVVNSPE